MRIRSALALSAVAAFVAVGTLAHGAVLARQPDLLPSHTDLLVSPFVASDAAASIAAPAFLSSQLRALEDNRPHLGVFGFSAPIAPGVALTAGSDLDLASHFGGGLATSGLFLTAGNSPYSALTAGGNFVGVTLALAADLHITAAHSALTPVHSGLDVPLFSYLTRADGLQRSLYGSSGQSTTAALDWGFAPWAGVGVSASTTTEQAGLLGQQNDASPLAMAKSRSNLVGASAHADFGDGWVTTVSYSEGVSQLDLKATHLLGNTDTRTYGVTIAKRGLFSDNDALGVAVSRPIQMFAGHLGVSSAAGIGVDDTLGGQNFSLLGRAPETDLELGYVTSFFNGALALQANAAYQMNASGQNGTNSLAVLSRAKINF